MMHHNSQRLITSPVSQLQSEVAFLVLGFALIPLQCGEFRLLIRLSF